jgi:hypothetical protein
MLRGNAGALIGHFDHGVAAISANGQRDGCRHRTVLDGVVDDVGDRFPEHETVGAHRHAVGGLNRDVLASLFRQHGQRGDDLAGQLSKIERLARQMDIPRIAVRQPQQRVDQRRQAVDLLAHAADGFLVLSRRAGFDQAGFADTADHGERRPQFV